MSAPTAPSTPPPPLPPPPLPPAVCDAAVVVTPAPRAAWWRAHRATASAAVTQSPDWLDAVGAATGWRDASRLYRVDGRDLVVPLVERGAGPLRVLASWPGPWGTGGLLSSDGRVRRGDLELVAADLARSAAHTTLVPPPEQRAWDAPLPGERHRTARWTQLLDLPADPQAVVRGYATGARRSTARAERAVADGRVELRRDATGALLEDFAGLYRSSARRWARAAGRPAAVGSLQARLAEPPAHLAAVAGALGDRCVVWAAFVDGRPAAASVVLHGEHQSLYWRGAMDRELAAPHHVTFLLHHRAIAEAVALGHRQYSFGESDEGSALEQYKLKFGARTVRWDLVHLGALPLVEGRELARATAARAAGAAGRAAGRVAGAVRRGRGPA